jgi:hypothetical protein
MCPPMPCPTSGAVCRPWRRATATFARIKLNAAEAQAIQDFKPIPGMPAEVHIKTGERTFFDYLTKPVRDSMARSFREY